jgi:hypothetical protein
MLYVMNVTMSISIGLYPKLDLWTANKLHYILLSKMKFYGISGVASKLMESYLRSRYQRVVINARNNSNGYFYKWKKSTTRSPTGFSSLTIIICNIY